MWQYYWLYKSTKSLWLLTGTSTDVSRYAGSYEHVFETTTAGVTIQAPQVILRLLNYNYIQIICLFIKKYFVLIIQHKNIISQNVVILGKDKKIYVTYKLALLPQYSLPTKEIS